jgi:hypothetical protein
MIGQLCAWWQPCVNSFADDGTASRLVMLSWNLVLPALLCWNYGMKPEK